MIRHTALQALCHFLEQAVPHPVAVLVVDGLEMVQIEQANAQQLLGLAGLKDGVGQPLGQGVAVVQPGQGVMAGLPGDFLLQLSGFGHVAEHQHAAHGRALGLADGGSGELDGIPFARAVQQQLVHRMHGCVHLVQLGHLQVLRQ